MVESNHAQEKLTRRSRTGFSIFYNMDLINWLSKKQPSLESAVFRAKFFAMKHRLETFRNLWYKLWMMGVPIEVPIHICGDSMSVIYNT